MSVAPPSTVPPSVVRDVTDFARALLAASMAGEGRAAGRMAAALNTLAPDPERRGRVLRLAARPPVAMASEEAMGVASSWSTLQRMLTGPSDTLYTSSDYACQLREMELRSHRLRLDAPEQLGTWIGSVSASSVRSLAVTLMLDLFRMEDSPAAISETARDLARLAEDLLDAGDVGEADRVLQALSPASPAAGPGDRDDVQVAWFHNTRTRPGPVVPPRMPALLDAADRGPLRKRLAAARMRGWAFDMRAANPMQRPDPGLVAARQVYTSAVETAHQLWGAAESDAKPDPDAARSIIDALATAVAEDRTSILSLTSLKSHDSYTFSHMINVSVLTMAQARSLGVDGTLLREFGVAGLMHDIGKTKTPPELLTKPGRLTAREMDIVKRHVVDGAQILRRTPDMPALASIVAFEHHLRQDLCGYPEKIGPRPLNLCTMLVSIADVFDALRTNRAYRDAIPTDRVRAMLAEQSGAAFEPTLLRRFIALVGMFPVGTFVRLQTGEVGIVSAEHPTDPFRPQVRLAIDAAGNHLVEPRTVNTWERDEAGAFPHTVQDAVDPSAVGLDPLGLLAS